VTNPNGRAWVRTLGGANFVLDWPKEENPGGPELKDGGSLFRAATDDEHSESQSQSQSSSSIAVAGSEKANACGQLLRLPGGAWAYCGAHPDDDSVCIVGKFMLTLTWAIRLTLCFVYRVRLRATWR